jgi:WXG100 family type VII secretion target
MPEKIKMQYPLMEAMAKTFNEGAQQLQNTGKIMQQLAQQMEAGALKGDGGQAFSEAITSKLCPAINRLDGKFRELQGDILKAMQDMMSADTTSKGTFQ